MYRWVLKRKIHVSWLIAICCVAILVGVFAAKFYNISNWILAPSVLMIFIGLRLGRLYMLPIIVIGGLFFGLWRGSITQAEIARFLPMMNTKVTVEATLSDDVDIDSAGQIKMRLSVIKINDKKIRGSLWATATNANLKRGDTVVLNGKMNHGFGNFVGTIYKAEITKIIHPNPPDLALSIRDWFASDIRQALPEPQSSLGIGFLVGQRRSLSADLVMALQVVGLTHIVVASGYNLTILVRFAKRLFSKISKYLAALSATVMVFTFLSITGVSPSMSRAALVSLLSLAAWYYGRKFHPIVLLLLAMAVTVLINPSYIWGDLGWQLSFAAFAGVMILAPLMQRYFMGEEKPNFIVQMLFETISAQIVTAPIIIYAFGLFSNVSIIANLLVLLFVPFAMLLTFIAGLGMIIFPAISTIISTPANWLLSYMINVINYFSALPWASSNIQFSVIATVSCYITIIGICIYLWRATKYNLRDVNLIE